MCALNKFLKETVIFAGEYGKICKGNIVSVADCCFS